MPRKVTYRAPPRVGEPVGLLLAVQLAQGAVAHGTSGKYGWLPAVLLPGLAVYADSSAGSTAPQLLYQAIGAGNLRPYVQGQDDRGGAALAN